MSYDRHTDPVDRIFDFIEGCILAFVVIGISVIAPLLLIYIIGGFLGLWG